ncbi:nucleoside/nucleotide kinase family protein [Auritidibacter ignavus]|uniref:nucleoside/nucleotide kinase family protein n=1 Tax=Auritidibacter ignavus TaxID=678932 RepID=UPI00109D7E88|nr:nucleoside/nucleotide kinase family protein [Auritidibacter ignavus]
MRYSNHPLDELLRRADMHLPSSRFILGITGPPGAGKSTLAKQLCEHIAHARGENFCSYIPMDGFHLSNSELERQGLRSAKGSPLTFDVTGYIKTLQRCHSEEGPIYVPDYCRELHEPVAASLRVDPKSRMVVTEGNYLLFASHGWQFVRTLLDECWFIDAEDDVLRNRLIARQMNKGKSKQEAEAWFNAVDYRNIQAVKQTLVIADVIVSDVF